MEEERGLQFRIFGRVITTYFKKSGKDFKFHFRVTKLEDPVLGINSNIDNLNVYDDKAGHILLLDYDNELTLPELIEECRRLQEKFKEVLGDAYIFESSPKKYHVHFYQPMTYWLALKIIHFSKCDPQYKKWRMCRNNMTLRLSPKEEGYVPKIIMCVPSRYPKTELMFMKKQMASFLAHEYQKQGVKYG
jgi:hypothetical protein